MVVDWLIIGIVAALASLLTFFSGFGLGTILMPVMAIFFPVDVAIALTAIVHFLNNIFKTGLIGGRADRNVVLRFGIPALLFAFMGAYVLEYLSDFPIHIPYRVFDIPLATNVMNVVIGLLLIIFAIAEVLPKKKKGGLKRRSLFIGGALSGFFGGLSGHQGALRSGFLIRLGLSKEAFIATGIVISLFVDISRLSVYARTMDWDILKTQAGLLGIALLFAFGGAVLGRYLLKKITLQVVHVVVAVGIIVIGILLGMGFL